MSESPLVEIDIDTGQQRIVKPSTDSNPALPSNIDLLSSKTEEGGGFTLSISTDKDLKVMGATVLIYKPDSIDLAKWEKHCIRIQTAMSSLGITARRVQK